MIRRTLCHSAVVTRLVALWTSIGVVACTYDFNQFDGALRAASGAAGVAANAGGSSSTGGASGAASTGGAPEVGGASSAGGTAAVGGYSSIGGNPSIGGMSSTGGTMAAGGVSSNGGSASTRGPIATGGKSNTGGSMSTGGTIATGGNVATGGTTTATGGAASTGGATGTGGTIGAVTTTCPGAVPAGILSSYCSCAANATTTLGNFSLYNNVWGTGAGPECVWAATTEWGVAANHPNTAGAKAFPNISISPKTVISAINTYTSSFDVTVPTSGNWQAAYDIWVKGTTTARTEIMLWMYNSGTAAPAGTATPATVGGHSWNVYFGNNGHDIVTFARTSNTPSGTVDIRAILLWIIANNTSQYGIFNTTWTLDQVQWGFNITSDGSPQAFVNNSYSVTSS